MSRTFTELGFSKSTLPADVWASMSAYYYNNRANTVREEWDAGDFSVNWWEQESRFIHIPLHLKVSSVCENHNGTLSIIITVHTANVA